MKKKRFRIILLAVLAVVFISGCKQNVGTPEDNAVVEEQEEEPEETAYDFQEETPVPEEDDLEIYFGDHFDI